MTNKQIAKTRGIIHEVVDLIAELENDKEVYDEESVDDLTSAHECLVRIVNRGSGIS